MYDAKTMTNLERAKKAINERWNPSTPKATHSGILQIAGQEIQCDVLSDGRRVLRQKTFLKAMGKGKPSGDDVRRGLAQKLPLFVTANNLTPYLEGKILEASEPIIYRGIDGRKFVGYEATILPQACKIYVKADDDGVLQDNQKKIASVCRAILYGLAEVGVIALVDDVTGYVYERERNELQIILEKYISKELMPWTKKFPHEFFEQIYRLHGWTWPKIHKNHPQCVGNIINKYVYEALPVGVLEEIKSKNPPNENGNRKHKHHQWLSESMGNKSLEKQVSKVVTLMKVSDNMIHFNELIERCN